MAASRLVVLLMLIPLLTIQLSTAHADEGEEKDCPTYEDCKAVIDQAIDEALDIEVLTSVVVGAAEEADPPGAPEEDVAPAPSEEEAGDDVTAREPPQVIKPGDGSELVKRIIASDPINRVLASIKDAAKAKLEKDFAKLKTHETVTVLAFSAPIIAGLLASPALGKPMQAFINDQVNSRIAKVAPWLSLKVDLISKNKTFELKVDLAPLLRRVGVKF